MGGAACGRWGHRGTSCFQKHNTEEQGAGENCPHHVEWGQLEHVAYRSTTREQNMRSLQMPLKTPHCLEVGFAFLKVLLRVREMGPASNYSKLGKNVLLSSLTCNFCPGESSKNENHGTLFRMVVLLYWHGHGFRKEALPRSSSPPRHNDLSVLGPEHFWL